MKKRTDKVCIDVEASRSECGTESVAKDGWKWAREHAERTGHTVTVVAAYDLWSITKPE